MLLKFETTKLEIFFYFCFLNLRSISKSVKLHIRILVILVLSGFAVHGATVGTDTITIPEKVMDLQKIAHNDGDRAGMWGLPTLVALRYGLRVDDEHDDRFDEMASRQAALHYLADLYAEFGDWDLCYYAYLYSPAYVKNLQLRNLSIPQPKPEVKRPAPATIVEKPKESRYFTYVVKTGDTLGKIAKQFKVTVSDIKKWNNLKSDFIRENQKLKIKQ